MNEETPEVRSVVPTGKSSAGLRDTLFRVLDDLRARRIEGKDAKEMVNVARAIIESAKVQLEYERLRWEEKVPTDMSPMLLGVADEPQPADEG